MSPVLIVRTEGTSSFLPLPSASFVVLKVYDPRYYPHRTGSKYRPAQPWTYAAEAITVEKRTAPYDPDFLPYLKPGDDDALGWEEWYYQHAELDFRNEVGAYDRLTSLQGAALPRCFATGMLQLAHRAIAPRVVLLEYLSDAKTLFDVDSCVVDLALAQSLVAASQSFAALRVVHADLNPGNILFVPGGRPTRAVIIDFAGSGIREDESEEIWKETVEQNVDDHWMKRRLKEYLGIDDTLLEPSG